MRSYFAWKLLPRHILIYFIALRFQSIARDENCRAAAEHSKQPYDGGYRVKKDERFTDALRSGVSEYSEGVGTRSGYALRPLKKSRDGKPVYDGPIYRTYCQYIFMEALTSQYWWPRLEEQLTLITIIPQWSPLCGFVETLDTLVLLGRRIRRTVTVYFSVTEYRTTTDESNPYGTMFTGRRNSHLATPYRDCLQVPENAVSFSSARTTKRFPSSRCASTIQIVRPLESIAETQPQLQPALLRLSAMISQYLFNLLVQTTC